MRLLPHLASLAFQGSADNCSAVQLTCLSQPLVSRITGHLDPSTHFSGYRVNQDLGSEVAVAGRIGQPTSMQTRVQLLLVGHPRDRATTFGDGLRILPFA
jgi:hypothetical protein